MVRARTGTLATPAASPCAGVGSTSKKGWVPNRRDEKKGKVWRRRDVVRAESARLFVPHKSLPPLTPFPIFFDRPRSRSVRNGRLASSRIGLASIASVIGIHHCPRRPRRVILPQHLRRPTRSPYRLPRERQGKRSRSRSPRRWERRTSSRGSTSCQSGRGGGSGGRSWGCCGPRRSRTEANPQRHPRQRLPGQSRLLPSPAKVASRLSGGELTPPGFLGFGDRRRGTRFSPTSGTFHGSSVTLFPTTKSARRPACSTFSP